MIHLNAARQVASLFWPTFEERLGVVLFAAGRSYPQLAEFAARTEAEAFYTHTHILDEFRHSIPYEADPETEGVQRPDPTHPEFARACELARTLAQMWLRKLETDFPGDRFRVYVTTRNDPIVRFHRVYPSERPWTTDEEAAPKLALGEIAIYQSERGDA